ncbi:HAD family hydrolase [Hutsoniella sourekii]|uniref:HAD family hydrolase n=1 Tax=Hutsoniella sourekii TaxID=87650 RepID=UPI0004853002|nr:Cof-type HAD-IIB family hydrolase [Hutsoniella sourekii]
MKPIKIIFFDIDGTLIDMDKGHLTNLTLKTLQALKANDFILCLATGRSPVSLPHFEGIDFDAYLTFNGSYCFNDQEDIYQHPLIEADIQQIVENANQIHRPVAIATKDRLLANGKDQDLVDYFSFAHQEVQVSDEFDRIAHQEPVYQLLVSCRSDNYDHLMQGTTDSKITAWWDRAVDIIPAKSGKGTGIKRILDYYSLESSQALAFGDGNNDIEMLEAVGWGLAMANASDDLKTIADEVIGHVADEGIYHYCVEHGLIEPIEAR